MPRTEKKRISEKKKQQQQQQQKKTNSVLKIGSRPVASGNLKLTRATKSRGLIKNA